MSEDLRLASECSKELRKVTHFKQEGIRIMQNIPLLLSRTLMSLLFLVSGAMKFIFAAQTAGFFAQLGLPAPHLMVYLIGAGEIAGGAALLAGYRTGIVATLFALWCIATGLVSHLGDPIALLKNVGLAGGLIALTLATRSSVVFHGRWAERAAVKIKTE
ncbi:DoxX family protein [Shinella zoogloeoides]